MSKTLLPSLRLSPAWSGSLFYLVHWGAMGVIDPLLNIYLNEIGFNGREIGWFASLFPFFTLAFAPFIAAIADRWQKRTTVLQIFVALTALCTFALGYAQQTAVLTILLVAFALARSPLVALADSEIAAIAIKHNINFGSMRLWGSLGFAVVAIAGGWLTQQLGFLILFAIATTLLAFAMWIVNGLRHNNLDSDIPAGINQQQSEDTAVFHSGSTLSFILVLIASLFTGLTLSFLFIFEGLYMISLGGNTFMVGLIFGIAALCELPFLQVGRSLMNRWGSRQIFITSIAIIAMASFGYAAVNAPTIIYVFAAMRGVGFALFIISSIQLIQTLAPAKWRGTSQSIWQACTFGIAPLIAGPVGGYIYDLWDVRLIFVSGGFTAIVAVCLAISLKKKWWAQSIRLNSPARLQNKAASS